MQPTDESLEIAREIGIYVDDVYKIALALDAAYQRGLTTRKGESLSSNSVADNGSQPSGNPGELQAQLEAMTALAAQRGEALQEIADMQWGDIDGGSLEEIGYIARKAVSAHKILSTYTQETWLDEKLDKRHDEVIMQVLQFFGATKEEAEAMKDRSMDMLAWFNQKLKRAKAEGLTELAEQLNSNFHSTPRVLNHLVTDDVIDFLRDRAAAIRKEAGL